MCVCVCVWGGGGECVCACVCVCEYACVRAHVCVMGGGDIERLRQLGFQQASDFVKSSTSAQHSHRGYVQRRGGGGWGGGEKEV